MRPGVHAFSVNPGGLPWVISRLSADVQICTSPVLLIVYANGAWFAAGIPKQ